MNMQHYRDVSARVTPRAALKEEVISMATEMQTKKRRPVMRRIGIALAAAAVAVGGMTVAVGAANGWDYQSIYTKYFSKKTEQLVEYDFTKIGQVLDVSGTFDFGTVTLESMLSTPYTMYLSWNVVPDESTGISPGDSLWMHVILSDKGTGNHMAALSGVECGEDGTWHFTAKFRSEETEIEAHLMDFIITDVYTKPEMESEEDGTEIAAFDPSYVISFTPDYSAPLRMQMLEAPITLEHQTADRVCISPLSVVLADEKGAEGPDMSLAGTPAFEGSARVTGISDAVRSVTAVYSDGMEKVVPTESYCTEYFIRNETRKDKLNGFRYFIEFDFPIETENLTAIVINGTEIPLK